MTQHERHETRLLRARRAAHLKAMKDKGDTTTNWHHVPFDASDELFPSIYQMTLQQRYVLVIIKTTALVIH